MDFNSEEFRKKFPSLARELEQNVMRVNIDSMRTEVEADAGKVGDGGGAEFGRLRGYVPDVIDFLRRCDGEEEAVEIIGFLERRGEVSSEYAARLRAQLRVKGLRSFGPKKEHGHYFKDSV